VAKNYGPTKDYIKEVKQLVCGKRNHQPLNQIFVQ